MSMTPAELTEAFMERGDAIERVRTLADEWAALCGVNEWTDDLPTAVWADAGRAIRAALETES